MDKFTQIISSVINSIGHWINLHPKAATAIAIFIVGFLFGILI